MPVCNPYCPASGHWLKMATHVHAAGMSKCAKLPVERVLELYHQAKYDVLAVTDHHQVRDLPPRPFGDEFLVIRGIEEGKPDVLAIGSASKVLEGASFDETLPRISGSVVTVAAHPAAKPGYWSEDRMYSRGVLLDGFEVFNGHAGIPKKVAKGGRSDATPEWDAYLSSGYYPWAFASDDLHVEEDFGKGFNMVLATDVTEDAVLSALKCGRFYATTGLVLKSVVGDGSVLTASSASNCEWRVVGPDGMTFLSFEGVSVSFSIDDACGRPYFRIEASSDKGRAWLQPVHLA